VCGWYVQKTRNAVLDHLNNYAESVCIDCGFVQRDCKCSDIDRRHRSSQVTFLGSAVSLKDSSMQTEPMVVIGTQQKVNAPGISVFVPQNYHLSPDVRMPLTVGHQGALTVPSTALNASSLNMNAVAPNIINLPPALTFPAGCPPSFVNPVSLSASAGTQSYVSVLRPPLLGAPNVPNSSSIESESPSRKRKLDNDANIAHASVQTTGKSYIKKMKLRLGDFSASDFTIVGKDWHLGKNQTSAGAAGVAADSGAAPNSQAQTKSGETGTNSAASPGGRVVDMKKDAETPIEKKYTTVWKLLEDSSDEECPAPSAPTSTNQEGVPVSASTEGNPASSVAPDDSVGASCTISDLTQKSHQHVDGESVEQNALVATSQTLSDSKEDAVVRHNDHPVKEEDDDDDKLVIDACADSDNQQSERENKSTVSQQSNDWEFRNGTQESESPDEEKEENKSADDTEQLVAASEAKTDDAGKVNDVGKGVSISDASDTSKLPNSLPSKSTADAAGSAVSDAEVPPDSAGETKPESEPKPKRVYGKFEYTPTGEHILRCLVPKCSQTFDRKLAADLHNHVHPGFVRGMDGNEGPMHLQCHRCEFQAPFYHWYDLLRHMRQKHDICLIDSAAEHTCEYCGLGFETKDLLVSHIDYHYSNRYKCINCGLLLLTWGQVRCTGVLSSLMSHCRQCVCTK